MGQGHRLLSLARVGPKLNYCLRDLELTRPGRRSPSSAHYPGCNQNPFQDRVTLRHLRRLVRHLPRRLRQAVDPRRRPARLLRLRDDASTRRGCSTSRTRTTTPPAASSACRIRATPAVAAASRGAAASSPVESAPSRRTAQSPPSSIAAMSTTVDGRPVSSPPSIARSAAATISAGTAAKEPAPARRLKLAEVWKTGHIAPASGPPIRRTPSRSRSSRQASG